MRVVCCCWEVGWLFFYRIRRFFIMFMLTMKNMIVVMVIHSVLIGISVCVFSSMSVSVVPVSALRVRFTMCVRGRVVMARFWAVWGREERGKNVPLRNSIGVISRNMG